MRTLLATAVLAVAATALIGATCVTNTRQASDTTWVGEVSHSGDAVHDAYVFARIFDAANREFFTRPDFRAGVCPLTLLPGGAGAFQLDVDPANIYSAGLLPPKLPLRAEFSPVAPGAPGVGTLTMGALSPDMIDQDGDSITVDVENIATIPYSDFELCGVARASQGGVASVAFAEALGFPALIQPGETITMELPLVVPPGSERGDIFLYLQHVPRPPTAYCCGKPAPADWPRLEAGDAFSVAAPPGWTYTPLQGIDSFVGAFEGDGVRITFDFGMYSSLGAFEGDPAFSFTTETIDGYEATFATPRAARPGLTGVLVEIDDDTELSMHAFDLTPEQQELVFAIFRSLEITP